MDWNLKNIRLLFFKFSHFCFQNALEQMMSFSLQELNWFLSSRYSRIIWQLIEGLISSFLTKDIKTPWYFPFNSDRVGIWKLHDCVSRSCLTLLFCCVTKFNVAVDVIESSVIPLAQGLTQDWSHFTIIITTWDYIERCQWSVIISIFKTHRQQVFKLETDGSITTLTGEY